MLSRLLVLSLLVTGCQSGKLKKDIHTGSIDNNYHSAEIHIDNKIHLGLAVVKASSKKPFSFSVFGINEGVIEVRSKECGIDEGRYYWNWEETKFEFPITKKRCILSVHVTPYFSESQSKGVFYRGLTGEIIVHRSSEEFSGEAHQLRGPQRVLVSLDIKSKARVYLRGCGEKVDKTLYPGIHIEAFEIKEDCILEGFIKGRNQDITILRAFKIHNEKFRKLSHPIMTRKKACVKVSTDPFASLTQIIDKTCFDSECSTEKQPPGFIRSYSSTGRVSICKLEADYTMKCFN